MDDSELKEEKAQPEEPIVTVIEVEGVGEKCEISIHALNGLPSFHTLRVKGYSEKKPLNILVDLGSTQFINVAGGGNRQTNKVCRGFTWMMQGTTFIDSFLLLPLRSYDMILECSGYCY